MFAGNTLKVYTNQIFCMESGTLLRVIDANLENNLRNVKPYLGILLVGSIALVFGFMIMNAARQLTHAIEPGTSASEGILTRSSAGAVYYGDTVSYAVSKSAKGNPNVYITTVCFQGTTMVFQKSTSRGTSVRLHDESDDENYWNGKQASCSAVLLYRTESAGAYNTLLIDSESFDVLAR